MQLPPVLSLLHFRRASDPKPCRCGHVRRAHEHYRSGTDCALCPCQRFRNAARPVRDPTGGPGPQDSTGEPRLVA